MSSALFSPKGQTLSSWVNGEKSIHLPPFRIALPYKNDRLPYIKPRSVPLRHLHLEPVQRRASPKPPFHLIALSRPDTRGEASCSWWLLLRLHVTRSFSSHGTSFLAFCLVTLTVLSTRCHETCHTPCWNWKAQCPQHNRVPTSHKMKRRIIWQDHGHPCGLWQIPDSLSKCSQSFH